MFDIMVILGAESSLIKVWNLAEQSQRLFQDSLCLCLHADTSVAGLLFLGNKLLVTETILFSDTSMNKVLYHVPFVRLEREKGRRGLHNSAFK